MTGPDQSGAANHERYEELAAGWLLDALDERDRALFRWHLRSCAQCRRAINEYDGAPAGSRRNDRRSPAERRSAVERRGDAGPRHGGDRARHRPSSPRLASPRARARQVGARSRWLAAGVVALLVLVFANAWQYRLWRDADNRADRLAVALRDRADEQRGRADRSAGLIRLLARPDIQTTTLVDRESVARAFVLVDGTTVQVLTDGLDVNDVRETTYVLWQIGDDGVTKRLGNFDVPSAQVGLARVGELPPEGGVISRFAVSLERGRRLPAKPTEIVVRGDVGR